MLTEKNPEIIPENIRNFVRGILKVLKKQKVSMWNRYVEAATNEPDDEKLPFNESAIYFEAYDPTSSTIADEPDPKFYLDKLHNSSCKAEYHYWLEKFREMGYEDKIIF